MLLTRTTWKRVQARVAEQYHRHFPERQIYFRSRGTVRFVALSPRFQFISLSVAFGAMLWIGIASASLIFGNEIIEHKDKQIADLRNIRSDLHKQLVHLQDDLLQRAAKLQQRQTLLDKMLERSSTMFSRVTHPDAATEQAETTPPAGEGPLPIGGPDGDEPEKPKPQQKAPEVEQDGHDPLADELSSLENIQNELFDRFDQQVDVTVSQLEKAISVAGLDLDKVLQATRPGAANQGGPLIALDDSLEDDTVLQSLTDKFDRLQTLEVAFTSIPLADPVDTYYISSTFGKRRDPFTQRWAVHSGVDLGGRWKAPIHATAPGTVTKVGWNGPYGRMVEIDHGNGFVTRYGHMRECLVKLGQVVQTGDTVGLMGNSGRSTGTHLHYEIRFDGAPLNPMNFFEAAKYVQAI